MLRLVLVEKKNASLSKFNLIFLQKNSGAPALTISLSLSLSLALSCSLLLSLALSCSLLLSLALYKAYRAYQATKPQLPLSLCANYPLYVSSAFRGHTFCHTFFSLGASMPHQCSKSLCVIVFPFSLRGCTDIICCVLFIVVILGYMAVGILAWLYGPLWGPVFYFDILKCVTSINIMATTLNGLQCPTTQVCVEKCPDVFWALNPIAYLPNAKPQDYFNQSLCVPSFDLARTTLKVKEIVDQELCPFFYTPTISGDINMFFPCVSCSGIVNSFNAKEIGVRIFEDFASSWQWIIAALVIAMVVSFLFLLLLRFIAPVMVWVLIFGVLAVGAYGKSIDNNRCGNTMSTSFTTDFKVYLQVKETWLAFLIILSVVEGILLLTLIFLRTRILIAIALIQESSKAVSHMMSTLFYPLITFVLLVVCVAYWGITALYLATSGIPVYKVVALNSTQDNCGQISGNETCDPQTFYNSTDYSWCRSARCIFIKYNNEGLLQRNLFNLQIYNVVAFLWCVNFVIAMGQCSLAGAFASYYWSLNKPSDIPTFPLSQAFIRTIRGKAGAAQNPCSRFLMCCLKCCFWCLEKFIKFLNRNAYIMIAVYGKNFCLSAKNAFMLLMRNIVRVVVLDKVTDLLLFFGKMLVVGGVGVLAFFFFSGRIRLPGSNFCTEMLNYYWMPIIVVVVGAYLIAHGFFSVYSMCVDTLFLCFLEDLERHDGTMQKPYYMSKNLMKILNKKNRGPKNGKGKD
uniref:Choline transporter-like protein n=1 Tax=Oncorhynchus kisutch TaxID=8019 RepID=A0A8C7G6Q5_ONCKI